MLGESLKLLLINWLLLYLDQGCCSRSLAHAGLHFGHQCWVTLGSFILSYTLVLVYTDLLVVSYILDINLHTTQFKIRNDLALQYYCHEELASDETYK